MFPNKELGKYYADDAKVIWNGNEIEIANRQAFQLDLPDSNHAIECFDVHPILSNFILIHRKMNTNLDFKKLIRRIQW